MKFWRSCTRAISSGVLFASFLFAIVVLLEQIADRSDLVAYFPQQLHHSLHVAFVHRQIVASKHTGDNSLFQARPRQTQTESSPPRHGVRSNQP